MSQPAGWVYRESQTRCVILRDDKGEIRARLYETGNGWTKAIVTKETDGLYAAFNEFGTFNNHAEAEEWARAVKGNADA